MYNTCPNRGLIVGYPVQAMAVVDYVQTVGVIGYDGPNRRYHGLHVLSGGYLWAMLSKLWLSWTMMSGLLGVIGYDVPNRGFHGLQWAHWYHGLNVLLSLYCL